MAVRTTSPWWFSALFAFGLFLLFVGERSLSDEEGARMILSGLGALLVVGVTFLRAVAYMKSVGERRSVEFALLLCQGAALLGVLLYVATTDAGRGMLGQAALDGTALERYNISFMVLYSILVGLGLIPMAMIEITLGASSRERVNYSASKSGANVEALRVKSAAVTGLTIGLALPFLMVTCQTTKERNIRKDVSYFKTSSPGDATVNMMRSISEPIKVFMFYPEVNRVRAEVRSYFETLRAETGNVEIEEHDFRVSAELAKKYRVSRDGTIVIERGEKNERVIIDSDFERARRTALRTLDSKVQKALMKVIRVRRVAYLTTGHGELNDKQGPTRHPMAGPGIIKRLLEKQNYQIKEGLASDIPDDATVVILLAPQTELLDVEKLALDNYLASGGAALIVLDPDAKTTLGPELEGRLGVKFNPTLLADESRRMPNRARNYVLVTNQFSSHASFTTLSRSRENTGIAVIRAGALEDTPFTGENADKRKRTYVLKTMNTTFADLNANAKFDTGEKKQNYNLAVAVEDPSAKKDETTAPKPDDKDKDKDAKDKAAKTGMRVMVFTDGELFTDQLQGQLLLAQVLFEDTIKWLGGEESFAGNTKSEKDVRIQHTRTKDVVWFYAVTLMAPLMVLFLGLFYVMRHRRA